MDLQIRVRKQVLTCRQTAIAGSVNFVKAKFMFDDEWIGTEIHVIFSNGDIPEKEIVLDDTLECVVPWEVLETEGDLYVSAVGLLDGDVRISTKLMDNPITVYPHGSMGGNDPLPPTPTVWDDIKNALPVDWNENDESKLSYIRNRTHWKEELEREHFELPNTERDPRIGLTATGRKVGLVAGQEYTLEVHLINGAVQTMTVVPEEIPAIEAFGVEGAIGFNIPAGALIDGIMIDFDTEEVSLGNNAYYKIEEPAVSKVFILDVPNVETVYHKIPKEYLSVDLEYKEDSVKPQSGIAVRKAIEKDVKPYLYLNRYLGEYHIATTEEVSSINVSSLRVVELERTFAMRCERLYVLVSFPDVANFPTSVPLKVTIKQAQYSTTSEICMGNILYEGKSKTCLVTYEYLRDGKFISVMGEHYGPPAEEFSPVGITFSSQVDKPTIEVTITLGYSTKIPVGTAISVWGEVYEI